MGLQYMYAKQWDDRIAYPVDIVVRLKDVSITQCCLQLLDLQMWYSEDCSKEQN